VRTWMTENLGARVPVVCAPMAGVADGSLAHAVSAAGGFGMIGVGARATPDWVTEQGRIAAASGRPFGVGLQAWAVERTPAQLEATLDLRPTLVSVSYGPYAQHVRRLQQAGILVATAVGNLQDARAAEQAGVDVIIARGAEGGGHGRNDVATLPLLQTVLDAVELPVLAAGGIGSGRGLAAVLAAGAAGAWSGTAFLTCVEGQTPAAARERLIAATDTDTVYGRVFDLGARADWPAEFGERALRNAFFDRWVGREDELAADAAAAARFAAAAPAGDYDVACLDAGQGVALLAATQSAAAVLAEFSRATEFLEHALGVVRDGPPARARDRARDRDGARARDRDPAGKARQARPRDATGRPLPYGDPRGVEPVSEVALPPDEALTVAQALLAEGRAFSAHEVLEAVWKAAPEQERDLWQGMAQLCVGITHAQRGNRTGASRLVRRGVGHLTGYAADSPHGIDVAGLLHWAERNAGDPAAELPRLRIG
jgi:nitronate monooxygenase